MATHFVDVMVDIDAIGETGKCQSVFMIQYWRQQGPHWIAGACHITQH
jgi:hypothetical protein